MENQVLLCIEALIQWGIMIIKWSLITAVVCFIFTALLVCILIALRSQNVKLTKSALYASRTIG